MSDKILIFIAVVVIAAAGFMVYREFSGPDFTDSDGTPIDISNDPEQVEDTETILPPMKLAGNTYFFTSKARYTHRGMIVSTRPYHKGFAADLSPYDYATIWGKTPEYLPYLKFDQIVRFCLFTYKIPAPFDPEYIQFHMANNHMIPSTKNIRRALKLAKKDDLVEFEGHLVYVMGNIKKRGTTNWNSSLRRTDKGNGACEIIYVTRLRINDRVYQ